ncbi:elongin C [Pichia californica]|uniref:Elongin-C n=1 Tax=Pichia californica TaxID=460514 RepID=A0A9P7BH39_9ASCO|nr:elongin C [[Candida] californica]KAG0690811.1 elongin C [[Candida] californica]
MTGVEDLEIENNTSKLIEEEDNEVAYVKLISNDGFAFIINKETASISGTLKNMISDTFEEGLTNTIKLHEIDGSVLEKVVEYLYYNDKYKDCIDVPEFNVPTEMALELLVAADYLQV